MTADDLERAGYRKHKPDIGHELAEALYQRRVRHWHYEDTLYFINVYEYRFPDGRIRFQAEARLYLAGGDAFTAIYVPYGDEDEITVGHHEAFFWTLYTRLPSVPDRHNQD